MSLVERLEQTGFHDSTIASMTMKGDRLRLEFINVIIDIDDDDYYRAVVNLDGVSHITRDREVVETVHLEREDSSVLQFGRRDHTATLVVVWRSYRPLTEETRVYEFSFNTFSLKQEKQAGCL